MDHASPFNLPAAPVNETFLRLTVHTLVPDVPPIVCKSLVFQGKPVGRLALYFTTCVLGPWFLDLWMVLVEVPVSLWLPVESPLTALSSYVLLPCNLMQCEGQSKV